jgi:hypothetical protein
MENDNLWPCCAEFRPRVETREICGWETGSGTIPPSALTQFHLGTNSGEK